MKKIHSDKMKAQFAFDHDYSDALKYLTPTQLETALTRLNALQRALEQEISDYALVLTHDLLDDETPQIVRTFWFSKGLKDYFLCVDGTGLIRASERAMPDALYDQILMTLEAFDS